MQAAMATSCLRDLPLQHDFDEEQEEELDGAEQAEVDLYDMIRSQRQRSKAHDNDTNF